MPKVSIIVVNYHSEDLVKSLQESLKKQKVDFDFEFLVEDNTVNNRGFGTANNAAAEKARGQYLLFLNPDIQLIQPDSLQQLINYLDQHPHVAVLGPRLIDKEGRYQWSADFVPTIRQLITDKPLAYIYKKFGSNPIVANILSRLSVRYDFKHPHCEIDWVSGAAMLVRREAFDLVRGFDPKFFMYLEDIDLCLRIKAAGYQICYWPGVTIRHLVGQTFQTSDRKADLYYQSQDYFMAKHKPKWVQTLVKLTRYPYQVLGLKKRLNRYY